MNESMRRVLHNYSRPIGPCDGANKAALRAWLKAVDHAALNTAAGDPLVIEMIGYLVGGGLAQFTRAITQRLQGNARTWAAVKAGIIDHYLGPEEMEMLQDEVLSLAQGAYETAREYANRYQEGVDRAYNPADLDQGHLATQLRKGFVKGLYDDRLRELVYCSAPATMQAAKESAISNAKALGQNAGVLQPLPVAAMAVAAPAVQVVEDKAVRELNCVVKALQKEVKANNQHTASILAMLSSPQLQPLEAPSHAQGRQVQVMAAAAPVTTMQPYDQSVNYPPAPSQQPQSAAFHSSCPHGCPTAFINQYFTPYQPGARNTPRGVPNAAQRRADEPGCWNCGKAGHNRRDCTAKDQRQLPPQRDVQGALDVLRQAGQAYYDASPDAASKN